MDILITIISAVLVLGSLIFLHELGHYTFARIFKVKINEFSLGMGPRLWSYTSKKTDIKYSLAAFPLGGFVAMAGEDSESDDPNSFNKKPAWQRLLITAAGPLMNLLVGLLAMLILTAFINIGNTKIYDFTEYEDKSVVSSEDSGLMAGDEILKINNTSVGFLDELSYAIMREGHRPCDVLVRRDGKELLIEDVVFPTAEGSGQIFGVMDFRVSAVEKDFFGVISYSVRKSVLIVKMCVESIFDLITGRFSIEGVTGPVGLSSAIGEAARTDALNLIYLIGFISINLGVMNLLPIPALDGGRSLLLAVEMLTKKRLPQRIENSINAVCLMILLGLSVLIMIKDVIGIVL